MFLQRLYRCVLLISLAAALLSCGDDTKNNSPYYPELSLPSSITVTATSDAGAVVTWTATATDKLDGDLPVSGAISISVGNWTACGIFDAGHEVRCRGHGQDGKLGSAYDPRTPGVTAAYSPVPVTIGGLL